MNELVLVTGGAGYIGSHIVISLLDNGYDVLVVDNLSNSSPVSLDRISELTGSKVAFVEGDVCDEALLNRVFDQYPVTAVIHCAGLKAVGESVVCPEKYYINNFGGTLILLRAMKKANIFKFVFSSSATVYGASTEMPLRESSPTQMPANPYGRSKLMVENALSDISLSDERWRIAIARYFNPIGAHESGVIGESPLGIPNNLVPFISQVAIGKLPELKIFGGDYPTKDGTGVRDYLHVMDLAVGHVKALRHIIDSEGLWTWNFGTGQGYSVLELVKEFEIASGKKIVYSITDRRSGDVAECWADVSKAALELGWRAEKTLEDMMRDTWRWQTYNPNGY